MLHQKMSSEILSLVWDGHYRALMKLFVKLLESSNLVDCTIAAEGQKLKAHKEILSAFSPYFELLFKEETENNPTIILSGISFKDLRCLIDFMYQGKLNISEDRLGGLIDVAECLQIKGLGGAHWREGSGNTDNTSILHKKCKFPPGIPDKRTETVEDPTIYSVETSTTLCHTEFNVMDEPNAENETLVSESEVLRTEESECLETTIQSGGGPSAEKLQVENSDKTKSDCSDAASSCSENEEESAFLKQLLDSLCAETEGRGNNKPVVEVKKPDIGAKPAEPLDPPAKPAAPLSLTTHLGQRDSPGPSGRDSAKRSVLTEKQLRCRHCGKMFRYISNLKYHLRTHTTDSLYRQHENNSGTVNSSSQFQCQIISERNKPYKCTECDFESIYRTTLNIHQRRHSKAKSYK